MNEQILNAKEQAEYDAVKRFAEGHKNFSRLTAELQVSERTARRYVIGYREVGRGYFAHGNRGKRSPKRIPDETRRLLTELYTGKYSGATYAHFAELAAQHEDLGFSEAFVRTLLRAQHILSPRATKRTRKLVRHELKALQASADTSSEQARLSAKILNLSEAHPTRPRRKYFGELLQVDASDHAWYGTERASLHIAVDDATSQVVGYHFDHEETLNGYYHMAQGVFTDHGIPAAFVSDKRTVFTYTKKEEDVSDRVTQFGYMCKCLGIQIRTTSIPQAKGRVERMLGTLQNRLPLELRLAGVSTLEEANAFLPSFFARFNAQFGISPLTVESAFIPAPSQGEMKLHLAVLTKRTIGFGSALRYDNKNFRPTNTKGEPVLFARGTTGTVARTLDNELYLTVDERSYLLEQIPEHELFSENFDVHKEKTTPKPPKHSDEFLRHNHPWRLASFNAYLAKIGRLTS